MSGMAPSWGPDTFRERSAALDGLLSKHGRRPHDVKRTVAALCFFGRTEETLEALRTGWGAIAGSPEVVTEQIRAYEQSGVEELMLQWFDIEDIEGAEALATDVLSRLEP